MSDDAFRRAVRVAVETTLQRLGVARAKQDWAFNDCPHINTTKVITREATHEHCDDCGATRSEFVIQPTMKDGEALMFRAKDFDSADATKTLVELSKGEAIE